MAQQLAELDDHWMKMIVNVGLKTGATIGDIAAMDVFDYFALYQVAEAKG